MEFAGAECMNTEADLSVALHGNGAKRAKFCPCLHPPSVTDAQTDHRLTGAIYNRP